MISATPEISSPTLNPLSSGSAFITSYPAVLLALGLMLVTWLVTVYNCFQHLLNYSREDLQMHIIRIVSAGRRHVLLMHGLRTCVDGNIKILGGNFGKFLGISYWFLHISTLVRM